MPKKNSDKDMKHAPVGNAVRSVYLDDRGEPYWTEWQSLKPGERGQPPQGQEAAPVNVEPTEDGGLNEAFQKKAA